MANSRATAMAQRKPFQRLPTAVVPGNYAIRLHPDLVGFTFTGQEDIDVEVGPHFGNIIDVSYCRWFSGERAGERGHAELRRYQSKQRKIHLFNR